jgi:hypothetical protein
VEPVSLPSEQPPRRPPTPDFFPVWRYLLANPTIVGILVSLAFVASLVAFSVTVVVVLIDEKPIASLSGWDLSRGLQIAFPETATSSASNYQAAPQSGVIVVYIIGAVGALAAIIRGWIPSTIAIIAGIALFVTEGSIVVDFMNGVWAHRPHNLKDLHTQSFPAPMIFAGFAVILAGIRLFLALRISRAENTPSLPHQDHV